MGPALAVLLLSLCAGFSSAAGVEDAVATLARDAAALKGSAGPPRMIIVGDSHTQGIFGHTLQEKLLAAYPGWRIEVYAECGSSPLWFLPGNAASGHVSRCGTWFHRYAGVPPVLEDVTTSSATPRMFDLLASTPAVVVAAFGTNMADWETGGVFSMASAKTMADLIKGSGARCVWIGPPDGRGKLSEDAAAAQVVRLNAALRAAVQGPCSYRASNARCYGPPAGIHCGGNAARAWGAAAAHEVQNALASPAP